MRGIHAARPVPSATRTCCGSWRRLRIDRRHHLGVIARGVDDRTQIGICGRDARPRGQRQCQSANCGKQSGQRQRAHLWRTFQPTHRPTRAGDDISVANLNRRRPRSRPRLPLVTKAGRMARRRACIGPPRIEQGKCCWMHNASDDAWCDCTPAPAHDAQPNQVKTSLRVTVWRLRLRTISSN